MVRQHLIYVLVDPRLPSHVAVAHGVSKGGKLSDQHLDTTAAAAAAAAAGRGTGRERERGRGREGERERGRERERA